LSLKFTLRNATAVLTRRIVLAKSAASKPVYRKLALWLVVLVTLYGVLGFVALPWWLSQAVPERLEQHLGWSADEPKVAVNPFAMTLTVTDLAVRDSGDEQVLRFDRLHLNLGFLQLFRGVVALDVIEVQRPFFRLDLLEGYGLNVIRDWQDHNKTAGGNGKTPQEADSPDLYFGRVTVTDGELLLRDFSQSQEARFEFRALDLALNNLATFSREGNSPYRLNAVINDQTIDWEGELDIAPFSSSGKLEIADISHSTLSHFVSRYLPYKLRGGHFTIRSDYTLSLANSFQITTSNGAIDIRDLALALPDSDENPALTLAAFSLDEIGFDLGRRKLDAGMMSFSGAGITLARNAGGIINVLEPFTAGADDADTAVPGTPWRWSVDSVQVTESTLGWRDSLPAKPVDLTFNDINFSLSGLSHELSEPIRYEAALAVSEGGGLSAKGQATLSPFTFEAGLSGNNLALTRAGPYLREMLAVDLRNGRLSFAGDLNLDHQSEPLTGTFNGNAEVTGLEIMLADTQQKLLSITTLRMAPIEYNLAPGRLQIDRLTLSGPELTVQRAESGALNLADIVTTTDAAPDSEGEQARGSSPALIFRVGEMAISDGTLNYADRSLEPELVTRLHQLGGSVYGLSNVPPQEGRLKLAGKVDDRGDLLVEGSLGALGSDRTSRLEVNLEQMPLTTLSPYFARFLGYRIDGGKLALEMDYRLKGSRVSASNEIIFDRLELGPSVSSSQAVNVPVKLGLALLRDRQGQIKLDLPVEGDLADPDFQIHRILGSTFLNLVVKAATSPFVVLGSVVDQAGFSKDELGAVGFKPGTADLGSGESEKLKVLARALSDRPALALDLRGATAPSVDRPALLKLSLFEELGITPDTDMNERLKRLETAYRNAEPGPALDALRAGSSTAGDTAQWLQTLVSALTDQRSLPERALRNLARDRGDKLLQLMLREYGVPGRQLYRREPVQDASVNDARNLVMVPFELDSR
jgi:hypothetical protein